MDLKRSDLNLLISLDTLLDELNVTRAAARLHLSQSTLSGQLARLREIFADPLLLPAESGRGMVPTERALELKPRLSEALVHLRDALVTGQFEPTQSRHTFVVAANDSLFTILGLGVLARIAAIGNPALRISFVPTREQDLLGRMERREIDLALGIGGKMPDGLKSRVLMHDAFRMAQRKGHPRGLQTPTLAEYCQLQHVMVSQLGQFHGPVDALLETLGQSRNVAVTVPSYNQVNLVLGATDCVATLPSRLLMRYGDTLDLLELPLAIPPFELAMAWHPRVHADVAQQWLRSLFVAQAADAA